MEAVGVSSEGITASSALLALGDVESLPDADIYTQASRSVMLHLQAAQERSVQARWCARVVCDAQHSMNSTGTEISANK